MLSQMHLSIDSLDSIRRLVVRNNISKSKTQIKKLVKNMLKNQSLLDKIWEKKSFYFFLSIKETREDNIKLMGI